MTMIFTHRLLATTLFILLLTDRCTAGSQLLTITVTQTLDVFRGGQISIDPSSLYSINFNTTSSINETISQCNVVTNEGKYCGIIYPSSITCKDTGQVFQHYGCLSNYETVTFQIEIVTDNGNIYSKLFTISVHVLTNLSTSLELVTELVPHQPYKTLMLLFPSSFTNQCSYTILDSLPNLQLSSNDTINGPLSQPLPCGYSPKNPFTYRKSSENATIIVRTTCYSDKTTLFYVVPLAPPTMPIQQLKIAHLHVQELTEMVLPAHLLPVRELSKYYKFIKFVFPVEYTGGIYPLFSSDEGALDVTTFTMTDLKYQNVIFRPKDSSIASYISTVTMFHYYVLEWNGRLIAEGILQIKLSPKVGLKPSVRKNIGISVERGENGTLSSKGLNFYPPLLCLNYTITVATVPLTGILLTEGRVKPLKVNETINVYDNDLNIVYQHNHSMSTSNSISDNTMWNIHCEGLPHSIITVLIAVRITTIKQSSFLPTHCHFPVMAYLGTATPLHAHSNGLCRLSGHVSIEVSPWKHSSGKLIQCPPSSCPISSYPYVPLHLLETCSVTDATEGTDWKDVWYMASGNATLKLVEFVTNQSISLHVTVLPLEMLDIVQTNQTVTGLNQLFSSIPYVQTNLPLPLTSTNPVYITSNFLYIQSRGYLQKEIVYHISMYPTVGYICLLYDKECPHSIRSFTQQDIQAKRVYYKPHVTMVTNDSFQFQVFYLGRERIPGIHTFHLQVLNRKSLTLLPWKQFWVSSKREKPLTRKYLRHFERHFQTRRLTFSVIQGPLHGVLKPIEFSWQDVIERIVVYQHLKENVCSDIITLRVTTRDQRSITANLTIAIKRSTNNKQRLSMNANGHRIQGQDNFILSTNDLEVHSSFCFEFVEFTVSALPTYGVLLLDDVNTGVMKQLEPDSTFSGSDIVHGHVTYQIFPDLVFFDETRDSFELNLRDPKGELETKEDSKVIRSISNSIFVIIIDPKVESELRLNITTVSPKMISQLNSAQYGTVIGQEDIYLSNSDFLPPEIYFRLRKSPVFGKLHKNDAPIYEFSLADIYNGEISYLSSLRHADTNLTSDDFELSVYVSIERTMKRYTMTLNFVVEWCYFSITSVSKYGTRVDETSPSIALIVSIIGPSITVPANVSVVTIEHAGNQTATEGNCSLMPPLPVGADYCSVNTRLHFIPSYTTKDVVRVHILDDSEAEGLEVFSVELMDPQTCFIPTHSQVNVYITDYTDDFPLIKFSKNFNQDRNLIDHHNTCPIQFLVPESVGVINITLVRSGNLNQTNGVICYTKSRYQDDSTQNDYIHRPNNISSLIYFKPGQIYTNCSVHIINDEANEPNEYFFVSLGAVTGHAFTDLSSSPVCVFIDHDKADVPFVFFEQSQIVVKELRDRAVLANFTVLRSGSDLNGETNLLCQVLPETQGNATSGQDYSTATLRKIIFASGQTRATGHVAILPDRKKEGTEVFYIVMKQPYNGRINSTGQLLEVIIIDAIEDMVIGFSSATYTISESSPFTKLPLYRHGDITVSTNVSCTLKSETADGLTDFYMFHQVVVFPVNSTENACDIIIYDDDIREGEETFVVTITTSDPFVRIADGGKTVVIIDDSEDAPVVQFKELVTFTTEPLSNNLVDYKEVVITLERSRGSNVNATVRYNTLDTPDSMSYVPKKGKIHFPVGTDNQYIKIPLTSDHLSHRNKRFMVQLSVDEKDDTRLGERNSTMVVVKNIELKGVYFPTNPLIRSYLSNGTLLTGGTLNYDLPLACITSCDQQLNNHFKECIRQGIDVSNTVYTWWLSQDGDKFDQLELDTLFTNTRLQVLEAVYLSASSWIKCTAMAVDERGINGYLRTSDAVLLSNETFGGCDCKNCSVDGRLNTYQNFKGSVKDLVELIVTIPAVPNTIPILTSRKPRYPALSLLTYPSARIHHPCSSLTPAGETLSFIPEKPLQVPRGKRKHVTHLFYRHCHISECSWVFKVWLPVKKLIDTCSANFTSNPLRLSMSLYISHVTITNGNVITIDQSEHVISLMQQQSTPMQDTVLPFDYYPVSPIDATDISFSPHVMEVVPLTNKIRLIGYSHSKWNGTVSLSTLRTHLLYPVYTERVNNKNICGWLIDVDMETLLENDISFKINSCQSTGNIFIPARTCVSYTFVIPLKQDQNGNMGLSPKLEASAAKIRELSTYNVTLTGNNILQLSISLESSFIMRPEYVLMVNTVTLRRHSQTSVMNDSCSPTIDILDIHNEALIKEHETVRKHRSHIIIYFNLDSLLQSLSRCQWNIFIGCEIESFQKHTNISHAETLILLPSDIIPTAPSSVRTSTPSLLSTDAIQSLPIYAFILILLTVVVLVSVCSITVVVFIYTLRQRWVFKRLELPINHEVRKNEGFHQPSNTHQTVASKRSRHKRYSTCSSSNSLSLSLSRRSRESSSSSSPPMTVQRPLQRSTSLPNLSSRDPTALPSLPEVSVAATPVTGSATARSSTHLISELQSLPKKERHNVLIATVKPLTNSVIDENKISTPAASKYLLDILSLKKSLSTSYQPQGVGWYERHHNRHKALALYSKIYLAADTKVESVATSDRVV